MPESKFGTLFVVVGPSGVGKRTTIGIALQALHFMSLAIRRLVTYTTRRIRPGEVDHEDYHFVSEEEFTRLRAAGYFLEDNDPYGFGRYATPFEDLIFQLEAGDVFLEVDPNGMRTVREHPRLMRLGIRVVTIFIGPPSIKSLEERLTARGSETDEEITRRVNRAKDEIQAAQECDYYLINQDGEQQKTAEQLFNVVRQDRGRSDLDQTA